MASTFNRLRFYYFFVSVYLAFQGIFFNILKTYNQDTHTNAFKILEIYKKLSLELRNNAQIDNSGLYKFVQMRKLKVKNTFDLTIVSQCSSNHFSSVEDLFRAWEGPLSIAIYSEVENIERTLWDMARFIHCHNWREFGMQLVMPSWDMFEIDYKFGYDLLTEVDKSVSCSLPYISPAFGRRNYNWTSPYPVNLLRNVAKKATSTHYILVIDIDMLPSEQLRQDFLIFAKMTHLNPSKIVFVVPAFETLLGSSMPQDKRELLKMVENNQARPFYIVPCENCQKLTKYDEWLESVYTPGIRTLYEVTWKHPWEPFLITTGDAPNFDERFRQYGMNRVSQICELHVAGFDFVVLDNAFLIHKGYKNLDDFHPTKVKEMEANRRVYVRFKIEVRYKYPESDRSC